MTDILLHEELVFEGLRRPTSVRLFYESDETSSYDRSDKDEAAILERYFSDIQNLFLKKFALFAGTDVTSEQETHKLRSLLEEMIKVKSLMERSGEKQ